MQPSQKHEAKESEINQPLKEVAKETKKTSHADDLLNLSEFMTFTFDCLLVY